MVLTSLTYIYYKQFKALFLEFTSFSYSCKNVITLNLLNNRGKSVNCVVCKKVLKVNSVWLLIK